MMLAGIIKITSLATIILMSNEKVRKKVNDFGNGVIHKSKNR
jgi:hypothetical protein